MMVNVGLNDQVCVVLSRGRGGGLGADAPLLPTVPFHWACP